MFLTLKITVFCNLVFFKPCKYFYSLGSFTAYKCLLSSIILDTQPLTLTNGNRASGMTWELPKKFYIRCLCRLSRGLPVTASPQGPSHLIPPAGQLPAPIHPTCEEEFVKASKIGSSAPAPRALGHPCL